MTTWLGRMLPRRPSTTLTIRPSLRDKCRRVIRTLTPYRLPVPAALRERQSGFQTMERDGQLSRTPGINVSG